MRFNANNSLPAAALFQERKKYKENVSFDYSFDFWYKNPLYGKVDRQGYAASLSETNLKQLQATKTLFAVDFVADAYLAFLNYLAKKVVQRRIALTPPFMNLELEGAWLSVNGLYHEHMQGLYAQFFSSYVPNFHRDSKIKDFDSFMHEFLAFVKLISGTLPICKSSFIKQNICPNAISGLVLEIQQGKNDDDLEKQLVLENSSFSAFSRAAKRFGFMIDKNNPYRLVFNVGSKQGQSYMQKYGITYFPGSASDLFDVYFYQVNEQQDIILLTAYLPQFYRSYAEARPWTHVGCKTIRRQPFPEDLSNNDLYWFKICAIIRLYEIGFDAKSERSMMIVEKAVALRKYVDEATSLKYLESELERG